MDTDIKAFWSGRKLWKKWKSVENALAKAFRSAPAATAGKDWAGLGL